MWPCTEKDGLEGGGEWFIGLLLVTEMDSLILPSTTRFPSFIFRKNPLNG